MHWHDFQAITLGLTRQSVSGQNLRTSWSCQSWEFEHRAFSCRIFGCSERVMIKERWWLSRATCCLPLQRVDVFFVFFLSHLKGLTFPCNRRKTAAWQMCVVVISSVLSVKALFVTSGPFNRTETGQQHSLHTCNHKSLFCCFNRTCQLLKELVLPCLCQLIDVFFKKSLPPLQERKSLCWYYYLCWPSCPLKHKCFPT